MRTPEDAPTDTDSLIRMGSIASVDPATGLCTVQLDDDVETPPLRWLQARAGATAIWSPPTVGEQVLLLCAGGEISAGIVLCGIASDLFPPVGADATERMRFSDGAEISYDPVAHALRAALPPGATTMLVSDGGIAVAGDISLTGNIAMTGTLTADGDVIADGISLTGHLHGGVQAGSAKTGAPQ